MTVGRSNNGATSERRQSGLVPAKQVASDKNQCKMSTASNLKLLAWVKKATQLYNLGARLSAATLPHKTTTGGFK
jgi:hypothetical protein